MARAAALVLVCASSVGIAAEAEDSGFLSDYSRLEKTRDSQGKTVRRWVSPELTPANYRAVLIDPVAFYPEPQPSEQVSAKTLEDIRAHLDKVLRETLGASVAIVEQPGAGVVRMRFALTAVATRNAGLKPYQYMPTALVLTTVKRLATDTPQKATLVNEVELTDSLSNERLGAQVREITGERLKKNAAGESEVSLAAIEAAIDEATKASAGDVDKYIAAK
jgi:hypothetical protein